MSNLLPIDPGALPTTGAVDLHDGAKYSGIAQAANLSEIRGSSLSAAETAKILHDVGVANILETISSGVLPLQLAYSLGVPQLAFRAWCAKHISSEDAENATKSCAEALMYKSLLAASAKVTSAAESSQAKMLSLRLAEMAQQLDSASWNKAPKVEAEDAPQPLTIVVQTAASRKATESVEVSDQPPSNNKLAAGFSPGMQNLESTLREAIGDIQNLPGAESSADKLNNLLSLLGPRQDPESQPQEKHTESQVKPQPNIPKFEEIISRPFNMDELQSDGTPETLESLMESNAASEDTRRKKMLQAAGVEEKKTLDIAQFAKEAHEQTKAMRAEELSHMDEFARDYDPNAKIREAAESGATSVASIQELAMMFAGQEDQSKAKAYENREEKPVADLKKRFSTNKWQDPADHRHATKKSNSRKAANNMKGGSHATKKASGPRTKPHGSAK